MHCLAPGAWQAKPLFHAVQHSKWIILQATLPWLSCTFGPCVVLARVCGGLHPILQRSISSRFSAFPVPLKSRPKPELCTQLDWIPEPTPLFSNSSGTMFASFSNNARELHSYHRVNLISIIQNAEILISWPIAVAIGNRLPDVGFCPTVVIGRTGNLKGGE